MIGEAGRKPNWRDCASDGVQLILRLAVDVSFPRLG